MENLNRENLKVGRVIEKLKLIKSKPVPFKKKKK